MRSRRIGRALPCVPPSFHGVRFEPLPPKLYVVARRGPAYRKPNRPRSTIFTKAQPIGKRRGPKVDQQTATQDLLRRLFRATSFLLGSSGGRRMEIQKEQVGDIHVVTATGRLDGIYSTAFSNQVGDLLTG